MFYSMGEVLPQIELSRGIRQGDPLSPYLFILCMEVLTSWIEHETAQGNWKGISLARNTFALSHLLFADDIILCGHMEERTV